MSQLTKSVEAKAKIVVAESVAAAEFLLRCDSNLELVLSSRICDDFPVMATVHKGPVGDHSPEYVVILRQESMSVVA